MSETTQQNREREISLKTKNGIVGWVNSSDRLPKLEAPVFLTDNVGVKRYGNFFEDDGQVVLAITNSQMHADYYVPKKFFHHYSWLDETPIESTDAQEVIREAVEALEWARAIIEVYSNEEGDFFKESENLILKLKKY